MAYASVQTQPLGEVVRNLLGRQPPTRTKSRALGDWEALYNVYKTFTAWQSESPFTILTPSQLCSFRLLVEWWEGDIQEEYVVETIPEYVMVHSLLYERGDPDKFRELAENLQDDPDMSLILSPELASAYHAELSLLWLTEFNFAESAIMHTTYVDLNLQRQQAATHASAHRLGWSCFKDVFETDEIESTRAYLSARTQPMGQLAAQKDRLPLPIIAEACPWLQLNEKSRADRSLAPGLPYYLWDVMAKKVVEVRKLLSLPQYCVISHTWGRWKQEGPSVEIDGVPWLVPQNTRFDVYGLPASLEKANVGVPYVWIDLFCIPQDGAIPQQAAIGRAEIARQGEIFSNATTGMIWLNEVENWRGLESAITWFVGSYLAASCINQGPDLEGLLRDLARRADQAAGIFLPYTHSGWDSTNSATAAGWFSSLWTLQEACLRPDMVLANRDWELLSIGRDNVLVTLQSMVALPLVYNLAEGLVLNVSDVSTDPDDPGPDPANRWNAATEQRWHSVPRAVQELSRLITKYEMLNLTRTTPVTILALANQRYCKRSRAQAIMSVIGATKWYTSSTAQYERVDSASGLVLGRFPLSFVKEVKDHVGALFFHTSDTLEADVNPVFELDAHSNMPTAVRAVGSLLPFSRDDNKAKDVRATYGPVEDYEEVRDWEIKPDGSVQIQRVRVLASSLERDGLYPERAPVPARVGLGIGDVDLSAWLCETYPDLDVHAVALTHSEVPSDNAGVILRRVIRDEKAGIF